MTLGPGTSAAAHVLDYFAHGHGDTASYRAMRGELGRSEAAPV